MSSDNRYVVIIGETGSANYFKRGKLHDPKIAIPTRFHPANMTFPHQERSVENITTSKTADCNCYTFDLEDTAFHFIDTPGINDTGGLIQDSRNVEKIFTYIEQLPEITALILILNGAVSRATINICHVLSTFQQRVPDIVYNNMIIILTNCQIHTVNFRPSDLGLPIGCPVFHMQNSAFSSDSRTWSQKTRNIMELDFKKSMDTISQLILKFLELKPQSTADFKDMDTVRNTIKRELHDARMMLMELQHLEDELVGYELSAEIHSLNVEKFRNFVHCKVVRRYERVPTEYYSTTCSRCNTVCHERCQLNEVPRTGSTTFLRCHAMTLGICRKCKCVATSHYHDRSVLQLVERTVQDVVSTLEERYREAKAGKIKANSECNSIQEAKKLIESEFTSQYNKVKKSVERLRQKCSNVNVSAELYDFIVCLKNDIGTLKTSSVIEKSNAFIAALEQLCKDMENTEIPTLVNKGNQQPLPSALPARKFKLEARRKTLIPQTSNTSANYRTSLAASQSIELLRQGNTEVTATLNNISAFSIPENRQSLILQQAEDRVGDDAFFNAEENFIQVNNSDKQIVLNRLNSSPENQIRRTVHDIGVSTEEAVENFAALTLDALIKASKRTQSKEIRKELDNRCRGKSFGFLSNNQHLQICMYFAELRRNDLRQLIRMRDQLSEEIQEATSYDPFDIEKADEANLMKLAALNLLIFSESRESSV
ncbi:unnamed protein product [Rotaria sp. Silwood1]|nr:unnamed protein product [Rotaria sp. Silwood1]